MALSANLCRSEQFSERHSAVNSVLWSRSTRRRSALRMASNTVRCATMCRLLVIRTTTSYVVLHTTWSCLWQSVALAGAAAVPASLVMTMMVMIRWWWWWRPWRQLRVSVCVYQYVVLADVRLVSQCNSQCDVIARQYLWQRLCQSPSERMFSDVDSLSVVDSSSHVQRFVSTNMDLCINTTTRCVNTEVHGPNQQSEQWNSCS